MDFWGFGAQLVWVLSQMWKSFTVTVLSGTAIGIGAAFAVWLIICVLILWGGYQLIWKVRTRRKRRAAKLLADHKARLKGIMMKEVDRGKIIQVIAQDAITDALEERYYLDELTLEEKDALYKRIAEACGWEDLLSYSKASKKEQLKRDIKKRTDPTSDKYVYKKVTLPDLKAQVQKAMGRFSGRLLKRSTAV